MQRQLRLGDILDDYCPRERRLTNHAVVAMVGPDVKQTRCSTCETEHEYKHAKVPRQRRKSEKPAALYSQVAAKGPKRVAHEAALPTDPAVATESSMATDADSPVTAVPAAADLTASPVPLASIEDPASPPSVAVDAAEDEAAEVEEVEEVEEGPVHRPLIRATLPRTEGQPPPTRPAPEFTIRQPGGRPPNRFRQRHQHGGGQQFFGNRSNGNMGGGGGPMRGGTPRPHGGRPPQGQGQGPQGSASSRLARRNGPGRKPSK
jgi:hypothetical protein